MSTLRPELVSAAWGSPTLENGTAYYTIYQAVSAQDGLIHGRLNNARGEHCAIGSYFALPSRLPLDTALVDEVATVNDSVPTRSPQERKAIVLRWLRWKLAGLGLSTGPGRPPKDPPVSSRYVKRAPKLLTSEVVQ